MKFIEKYWILIVVVFAVFAYVKIELSFLLLSSIIFYIAFDHLKGINNLEKNGVRTIGTVVGKNRDRYGYQSPVIRFICMNGNVIEKEPFYYAASDINKFQNFKNVMGKEFTLLYDKNHPEKFVIAEQLFLNRLATRFMIFISLLFFIVAVLSLAGVTALNDASQS